MLDLVSVTVENKFKTCKATNGKHTILEDSKKLKDVFVKVGTGGQEAKLDILKYEALCLEKLSSAVTKYTEGCLTCPKSISTGIDMEGNAYICMEYLKLEQNKTFAGVLGKGLGLLHKRTAENKDYKFFGFPKDGQCGAYPQLNNTKQEDISWVEFWRKYRLGPQIDGIRKNFPSLSELVEKLQTLSARLEGFFDESLSLGKSLLHGDLWSGNWATTVVENKSIVVIYDPACYYGHNEADLGIADMFGMPDDFYSEYFKIMPKTKGYNKRRLIYELHHHLNHLNIFGITYTSSTIQVVDKILS